MLSELVLWVQILTPTNLSTAYLLYSAQGTGVPLSKLKSPHFPKTQLFVEGSEDRKKMSILSCTSGFWLHGSHLLG